MSTKILRNEQPQSAASQKAITVASMMASTALTSPPVGENGEAVVALPEPEEVTAIRKAVTKALDAYAASAYSTMDAKIHHETAIDSERGVRERLMLNLSEVSAKLNCTKDHIDTAVTAAVAAWSEGKNTLPTTLAQFTTECKRAMHPAAREHVKTAYDASREAWSAEVQEQADWRQACKDTPKGEDKPEQPARPLQDAFIKRDFMVAGHNGVLQTYIDMDEKKNPSARIDDPTDFETLAAQRLGAKQTDPRRAARELAKLADTLQGMFDTYHHDDIKAMLDYANDMVADKKLHEKLEASRMNAIKAAKRSLPKRNSATSAPSVTRTKHAATTAVTPENTDDAIDNLVG